MNKIAYKVKDNSILSHNRIFMNKLNLYQRKYITKENDLSPEHLAQLKNFAKYEINTMSKTHEVMQYHFPGCLFDAQLLHRKRIKEKDLEFGPDHNWLPQLFQIGENHKKKGGVFKIGTDCETFR